MSDNHIPIEKIADLVGHRSTIVPQAVYRHQLRPVIETGATAMNTILNREKNTGPAEVWLPFGSRRETYIRKWWAVLDLNQ